MIPFYFLPGYRADATHFFSMWVFLQLHSLVLTSLGIAIAIWITSAEVGYLVSTTISPLISVFAGFAIIPSKIPDAWLSLYYLLPGHYTYGKEHYYYYYHY